MVFTGPTTEAGPIKRKSRRVKHGGMKPIAERLTTVTITTATATTATTAFTAAAIAATATRRALFARTRFVDRQRTALKIFLVKHFDGFVGIFLRSHLNEGKAARTACHAILHDIDRHHGPGLGEMILQIVFGGAVSEVPNKQFSGHRYFLFPLALH